MILCFLLWLQHSYICAARIFRRLIAWVCDRVAATLAASEGVPLVKADFVLEGGSVHTDGEGCALRTL